jgi:hypothetical protein
MCLFATFLCWQLSWYSDGLDGWDSIPRRSDGLLSPIQPNAQWVPGVKRSEREVDRTPPSSAKVETKEL